jgi:5-methylcytosine-specific restriction enzyme subunit McrC
MAESAALLNGENSQAGFPELKDNSRTKILSPDANILDLLRHFSSKSFKEIKTNNSAESKGLLIMGSIEDLDEKNPIFTLLEETSEDEDTSDGKVYYVQTYNIMGVFTLRHEDFSLRMRITSRFDQAEGKQPFLCWLLGRVLRVTLSDFIDTSESEHWWTILVELLFWRKLGEAASIGLFRQYQTREYNDLRFRGRLDIDRHIRLNMPLWDKIAYSRREIVYDNPVNHLLRHAIKIVLSHWSGNITGGPENKDALDLASAIETNTPSWSMSNLQSLLMDKELMRSISQPFYAEYYEDLRILALCIVLGRGVDLYSGVESSSYSINGIVFDGAWLWEEYLSTILSSHGFIHAIPKPKRINPIYAIKEELRPLFPDFRLPVAEGEGDPLQHAHIILDAKYKKEDSSTGTIERLDMHQCLCYMLLTGAQAGGVIYPPLPKEEKPRADDCDDEKDFLQIHCPGKERYWRCFTFKTVLDCSETDFSKRMEENEENLRQYIEVMKKKVSSS